MVAKISPDSYAELSHNVQDFNESMLPRNITSDDIAKAQGYWKSFGNDRREYLYWQSAYQASPFPYRWHVPTQSSIIPE